MTSSHGDTTREAARRKRRRKPEPERKRPQLVPETPNGDLPAPAAAPTGIKFELARLSEYSDAAILGEIRRVAALVPGRVFTMTAFERHSRVLFACVWKRFGSWSRALEAAGLAHRSTGRPSAERLRWRKSYRATDEELLDELRAVVCSGAGNAVTREDVRRAGGPGEGVLAARFGTWQKAAEAAGLKLSPMSRRYGDAECFENLLRVWTHYARPPRYIEMNRPPSQIGVGAYVRRFNGWGRALEAFVRQANAGDGENRAAMEPAFTKPDPQTPGARANNPRSVPLSLRFQVLTRDRFKCTACGLSPAIDPFCRLHVDHVVPASLGGRTELGNLRALCAYCNIGRGNRVEEEAPESIQPSAISPQPNADG
ncbi:MAG: homing endonuclease associated repeat-containing protein [Rhodospirillales bacterium]